jgi:hypothetical protein
MGARAWLSPTYLCMKTAPSKAISLREGDTNTKNFTIMVFKEVCDCKILISETEKRPALYDCSTKEYSDKEFQRQTVGRSVRGNWSQLDGPEKREKGKQCCFSIYLIKMHRFTLICCKIQSCLTLQRKLTLAESYDFLVVVNKGQYFSKVC